MKKETFYQGEDCYYAGGLRHLFEVCTDKKHFKHKMRFEAREDLEIFHFFEESKSSSPSLLAHRLKRTLRSVVRRYQVYLKNLTPESLLNIQAELRNGQHPLFLQFSADPSQKR